jgi:Rps23 Pro-64 3,4-dihydroxylase Tpa1-like proline 4-hydroxylase
LIENNFPEIKRIFESVYLIKMDRKELANIILEKLDSQKNELSTFYATSNPVIKFFYIDNVFPDYLVEKANVVFPSSGELSLNKSLKEQKYVSAQMNKHHPVLEEILYAFQDARIVQLIQDICGIDEQLYADEYLYAGGVSLMSKDCFLNPHLDNSHDSERNNWRALNLLYYVTPDWKRENGGNLELWPNGVEGQPIEIQSKHNRLVVMSTHDSSWHSVNKVMVNNERKCISNYYFSQNPLPNHKEFHVTIFKGRPNQKLRKAFLNIDSKLRMGIRKIFKKGIRKNPHIYKK